MDKWRYLSAHRNFNPRSPHGERPVVTMVMRSSWNFNPRSPHGERRASDRRIWHLRQISTHAPRTGSDGDDYGLETAPSNFNPRSPHGERQRIGVSEVAVKDISTHAPRTGSDAAPPCARGCPCSFQPTLPARGATQHRPPYARSYRDFNPRSPHGERLSNLLICGQQSEFQPTLPARGATHTVHQMFPLREHFNPRSPHGERQRQQALMMLPTYFNPRSPHGERPKVDSTYNSFVAISTHAPRTGSDGVG